MKEKANCPVFILAMALLIGLGAWQLLAPDAARSDVENRPLAQFAAPTLKTIGSGKWMKDMETYVSDQFPTREGWMNIQATWETALLVNERNGILLGKDGWLFEKAENLSLKTAEANTNAIAKLSENTQVPVTWMLVPMSSAVYTQTMPRWYVLDDQGAIVSALYEKAPGVQGVDVLTPMLQSLDCTDAPLFFRTDHHWTDAGAQAGYQALLAAWGMNVPYANVDSIVEGGFYGTYASRAPSPWQQGDALRFAWPKTLRLWTGETERTMPFDPDQMTRRDKYASLLWGNHGRMTLKNEAAQMPDKTLLVVQDSYANMLLPLLSGHYARIETVDPRYYAGDLLALIDETEADAILCVYGLTTFLTDRNLLLLSADW